MIGANQQLSIYTSTATTKDAEGVAQRTWAITETVSGLLHSTRMSEMVAGSYQVVEDVVAYLPPGTAVDFRCVIETEDGTRYRVQTVAPRRGPGGAVHHLTVALTKASA